MHQRRDGATAHMDDGAGEVVAEPAAGTQMIMTVKTTPMKAQVMKTLRDDTVDLHVPDLTMDLHVAGEVGMEAMIGKTGGTTEMK